MGNAWSDPQPNEKENIGVTARGTVYAPPTALYTMTNITRKVLIFKKQNFEKCSVFWHQLVFYRG